MLEKVLKEKQELILKRWFQYILDTYPADTGSFLLKEKNRFNNPVGYTISTEIQTLYEELLGKADPGKLYPSLEKIIKILSVQDFSAGEAIGFIFLLKKAIHDELCTVGSPGDIALELLAFQSKIDHMVGLGLDIYTQTRERLYEIKVNEIKARTFKLLERANLIVTIPDDDGDSINTDV